MGRDIRREGKFATFYGSKLHPGQVPLGPPDKHGVTTYVEPTVLTALELLDALKGMMAASEEPDPESKSPRAALLGAAWQHARDAIAKAEERL